jgi:hypothetical protein
MSPTRARNAGGGLSEAAWQQQVEGLAAFYGFRCYHTHDSRRSAAGFPDLVLVRGAEGAARATVAQVAARPEWLQHRDISEPQAEWLDALRVVADAVDDAYGRLVGVPGAEQPPPCVEVHVWRPVDFDEVHARLARGRQRQEPAWRPAA